MVSNQPYVRFIHQIGALKSVPAAFVVQVPASDSTKLIVNQRDEGLEGIFIALAPSNQ